MSTPTEPQTWKEGRRMRAFEFKEQGWKQIDVAKALDVKECPHEAHGPSPICRRLDRSIHVDYLFRPDRQIPLLRCR